MQAPVPPKPKPTEVAGESSPPKPKPTPSQTGGGAAPPKPKPKPKTEVTLKNIDGRSLIELRSKNDVLTLWGDPHVSAKLNGKDLKDFNIPAGARKIKLKGGANGQGKGTTTVSWTTDGKGNLTRFKINFPGTKSDVNIDVNDGKDIKKLKTVLSENQLESLIKKLNGKWGSGKN